VRAHSLSFPPLFSSFIYLRWELTLEVIANNIAFMQRVELFQEERFEQG